MPCMNRIDRLFGILLRLQRRGRVRALDLAQHFEVSERTIYRDIAALNELGVPIISLPNTGYELPEGFNLPPLFFTAGEAGALALAVQLLLAQTTGATSQDAERALAKILVILPHELRQRIQELGKVVRFYTADRPFDLDDPRVLQLHQAIAARQLVQLRYHSYRGDERLDRAVEPETLTFHKGAWYVSGYCRLRHAPRSFRLDRIDALHVLDEHFIPRAVTQIPQEPVLVRVRFARTVLRWVRERQHFGYIADEEEQVLRYAVTDPSEMVPWLLSWGASAEVLEPAALRSCLREEAQKLTAILT
jgi:predicted DNA-binding transcriptional regulator YafY